MAIYLCQKKVETAVFTGKCKFLGQLLMDVVICHFVKGEISIKPTPQWYTIKHFIFISIEMTACTMCPQYYKFCTYTHCEFGFYLFLSLYVNLLYKLFSGPQCYSHVCQVFALRIFTAHLINKVSRSINVMDEQRWNCVRKEVHKFII